MWGKWICLQLVKTMWFLRFFWSLLFPFEIQMRSHLFKHWVQAIMQRTKYIPGHKNLYKAPWGYEAYWSLWHWDRPREGKLWLVLACAECGEKAVQLKLTVMNLVVWVWTQPIRNNCCNFPDYRIPIRWIPIYLYSHIIFLEEIKSR